jgi:hypothetical protein
MTASSHTLRVATPADGPQATELLRRLGLVMPAGEAAIAAHWRRLWVDNPALRHDGCDPLPGWVLESGGRMVGFFANYAQTYFLGETRLAVAIASQWGVDKAHRTATALLSDAYFAQPHADMILVTTGIKATGRLFDRYGGIAVPQPDLDRTALWVVGSGGFLAAMLRKKGWRGAGLAHLAAPLAAVPARLRWPPAPRRAIGVSDAGGFDGRFDDLFAARRRDQPDRLLADRGSAALAWHVAPHAARNGLRVLTAGDGQTLDGYALMLRDDAPAIGLVRWRIAALLVRGDDPATIADLIAAAVRLGAADGAHVVEIGGMAEPVQRVVAGLGALTRSLPTWPCFFRMKDGQPPPPAWYLSAYDGDAVLF